MTINYYDKDAKKFGGYAFGKSHVEHITEYPSGDPEKIFKKKLIGLANKNKIALMKKDAFIVSITGEKIFDLDYAVEKVRRGQLAGVAAEHEKKNTNDYPGNVWITPPIAWFTREAFVEDMRIWVETIISVAKGMPINVVN